MLAAVSHRPTPPPIDIGDLAADIYHQLRLMVPEDEENGWPFAHYVAAKYSPGELVESWARDTDDGPGWSVLLDLERCPEIALPWLSQFKGVVIPVGMPPDQWRDWIRSAEGLRRGSIPALIAAGQRNLTGDKVVRVINRAGPTAFDMVVITRTSETPETDLPLVNYASLRSPSWRISGAFFPQVRAVNAAPSSITSLGGSEREVVNPATDDCGPELVIEGPFKAGELYAASLSVRSDADTTDVALALGILGDLAVGSDVALTTGWQQITVQWTPAVGVPRAVLAPRTTDATATTWQISTPVVSHGPPPFYADVLRDFMSAKRIGQRLAHVVSDAPLIDEGTAFIDDVPETIDAATLADVT